MTEITRRRFLQNTGAGTGAALFAGPAILRGQDLDSKIRVACIGVGGKGDSDTDNAAAAGGEIVAICEVDANTLDMKSPNIPEASQLVKRDYRKGWEPV